MTNVTQMKDSGKRHDTPERNAYRVSGAVSDLFFNHDVSMARMTDKRGMFSGWNTALLLEEANWFRNTLIDAGLDYVPGAHNLVDDFLARV